MKCLRENNLSFLVPLQYRESEFALNDPYDLYARQRYKLKFLKECSHGPKHSSKILHRVNHLSYPLVSAINLGW